MLIAIRFDFDCPCGADNAGVMTHSVRVNKGSIRSVPGDRGLGFFPDRCKACNEPLPSTARQSLVDEDLAKVNAVRAKHNWPPLASGSFGVVELVRTAQALEVATDAAA